ncbi:MAG TPA: hypothetical protein VGP73_28335 [Thermoanaerobaculia bacterium]
MSWDPFYEEILAGLNGPLDRYLFQDCITDLLRDTFPSLVPVRGGKDSGMDGAIADGEGEPYPLIVTTAKDVKRNLTRSLDSLLKRKRPRRKVVLATSRALTPEFQHKLKDVAQEKGFTLVGLIEQSGVADRLRENGYWRERLLGLTGEPSTLSAVPASRRPLLGIEPVGRDGDIEWLKATSGDRVLSGAPGSGKTFLLYHLTRQGWGVFVLDPKGQVAKDLRNQKPEVVIFDDAHVQPEFLVKLRHLRQEMKLSFSIVATTWEWEKDKVVDALGVSGSQVHRLELLTRDEIVEVYRRLGVQESPDTMRYLVDQAANKPGLAATIGMLWLQGEWQDVIKGEALSRTLLTFFQRHVGPESTDILAAFGLGGDQGMEVEVVREFLGLGRAKIRQLAAGLAAGGALSEVGRDVWAVWPQSLRFALIRTVFFPASAPRHPYQDLVGRVPNLGRAVETLISAKAVGADIPLWELRNLVVRSSSLRAWEALVQLDKEEAEWVLDHYSGDILTIAADLLRQIPRMVIPRILARAAELTRSGVSRSEHPMSILSAWVEDIAANPAEALRRRWMVAKAAEHFLLEGGDHGVGVHGICIALSPKKRGNSRDPGKGDTVSIWSGLLPAEALRQIELIWEEMKGAIQEIDAVSWQHLSGTLWDWIYPDSVAKGQAVAMGQRDFMHGFAARILRDLTTHAQSSPGLKAALELLAIRAGITLNLEQDATFLLFYPKRDSNLEVQREREGVQREQIKTLAAEWSRDPPNLVAERVVFYEREAQRVGLQWSRNVPALCRVLADMVRDPESWLAEFVSHDLRGHLISPFLERIVRDRREGWEGQLDRCLSIRSLQWSAATLILTLPSPAPPLLEKVLAESAEFSMLIEGLCLGQEVPLPTLSRLLRHPQWETALSAAVGEWCAEPQSEVREEILHEWRSAILRSKTEEYSDGEHAKGLQYWLGGILSGDPDLALEWLRNRLRDHDLPWHFLGDSPFANALRSLRMDQRMALLQDLETAQELESTPIIGDMIPLLIQGDVELYRKLLLLKRLSDFHLAPLEGLPQSAWSNLALVALQADYEPAQIAATAFEPPSWGSGIEYWENRDLALAEIEREGTEELQEIARHGRRIAQEELRRAKAREKKIGLHGFHLG